MDLFDKAFSTIETLASGSSWPQGVRPVMPGQEEDETAGFWPSGFVLAGIHAGIKPSSRKDLMLIVGDGPTTAAALFTTNLCCAAPVELSRSHLRSSAGSMRAIVCNSGNANAATGSKGYDDALRMAADTAAAFGLAAQDEVLVASTGVIGQLLPSDKISSAMPALKSAAGEANWRDAAEAIMTTDTFPKFFAVDVALSCGTARIAGIAKGSGMICPDMATMLGFLCTDASIAPDLLQQALAEANRRSFNAITVDGDTSTNDMVAILASCRGPVVAAGSDDFLLFTEALKSVMTILAKLIVIDGEGATKFVEIRVVGTATDEEAERVAKTIANSPLVKTAIHGEDANWGRIIAAAGRAGVPLVQERLEVYFDDLPVLKAGLDASFSEEKAKAVMSKAAFSITLSMGSGAGHAVVWSCDLSKRYIEINGSYRS